MEPLECFAAVASCDAEILILGSMPGDKSLQQQQYYAHPRNSFWFIMQQILNVDKIESYAERLKLLQQHRIALWDVMQNCVREGSLDSAIKSSSVVANNFLNFFQSNNNIQSVFFNGARAEQEYRKHVLPDVKSFFPDMKYTRLPSTSPAMASMNREQKLVIWREAIKCHQDTRDLF